MNRSGSHPPFNDDTIEAAAASWLAQREEGFTPEQESGFLRWRLLDPRHAAALDRLEETIGLLGQLPELAGDARFKNIEEDRHASLGEARAGGRRRGCHPDGDLQRPDGTAGSVSGGAGSCAKESAFQSSDWLEVFTNAPAHRPLKHSISLNAATWPKLGCPGDPQHERCFRVVEGDLMDGDRKTLCSLVLHVYMTNDVTPKKPKAADPETPSIAKLEIPVWDRQDCWLRWDAPEPPSR